MKDKIVELIPHQGTAFIFSMKSANEFEYIGRAVMVAHDTDN